MSSLQHPAGTLTEKELEIVKDTSQTPTPLTQSAGEDVIKENEQQHNAHDHHHLHLPHHLRSKRMQQFVHPHTGKHCEVVHRPEQVELKLRRRSPRKYGAHRRHSGSSCQASSRA